MAITKQFQAHTELKAEDLNELIAQSNEFILTEGAKKPDKVDILQYHTEGAELPLAAHYTYGGLPTVTFYGHCNETEQDYIAICTYHCDTFYSIHLYVKNDQNKYVYNSDFHDDNAETTLERSVSNMISGTPVSLTRNGVMTKEDKAMFDDMVTEVFPLTVAVASSNAGTREVGTSTTPIIVLSVTRKGVNIDITSDMLSVSPNDGSLNAATKTYTGAAISSGSKTYQIAVTQGGQTRSIPNQVFKFLNYVYGGELSSKPANAAAVKAQIESWGSSHGVLSDKTNSTAIYSTGVVPLSANNYYLFAVRGSVNLVCRHAGTDAVVTGCTTGTATIQRVNNSGSDSYSYIIVEKSQSAWSFKITNS